ncbi:Alpha/beta hydrolase of unknown function [Reichenbachiella faecimaris]|uniref:Esterase/lipase superfamily enzyme n=1 Tax=Reichenbachiella faecimaris TaxID=692418 RepID=A0A1W2G6R9_REIFA|nr:alpha/beta hydrolase [Reichenbachiella faecimaris]SMD32301.1 Alpha/beta hydrolase of unknown function [Reichenbachiella faecimaris]
MLFITNRGLTRPNPKKPLVVDFNLDDNDARSSVFFCERTKAGKYTEIGSIPFFQQVKKSKAKQILIYIHGFNNLPEGDREIFHNAEQLQALFDDKDPNLVEVIPMIWPCDNDKGMLQDYWDDQRAAYASAGAFSRVFEKFLGWRDDDYGNNDTCLKRINILAHSMGNRVLKKSLLAFKSISRFGDNVPMVFRNIFMVAADVVNETLHHDHPGKVITEATRNVAVFYAADDLALRASKVINLKNKVVSRRLGHTGPENMQKVPKNVFAFDCDEFNNKCEIKGHSYFIKDKKGKPTPVFNEMLKAIQTGRVSIESKERNSVIL